MWKFDSIKILLNYITFYFLKYGELTEYFYSQKWFELPLKKYLTTKD